MIYQDSDQVYLIVYFKNGAVGQFKTSLKMARWHIEEQKKWFLKRSFFNNKDGIHIMGDSTDFNIGLFIFSQVVGISIAFIDDESEEFRKNQAKFIKLASEHMKEESKGDEWKKKDEE